MTIEEQMRYLKEAERVCVIGSPGSGKTTFSLTLANLISLPVIRMNDINEEMREVVGANGSKEAYQAFISQALTDKKWITDGYFSLSLDIRFREADVIVFLDMPLRVCLFGVFMRGWKNFIGLANTAHSVYKSSFLKRTHYFLGSRVYKRVFAFHKQRRPFVYQQLHALKKTKPVLFFHSRQEVNQLLHKMDTLITTNR